jgi:FAD/FMN-containing dehydrogenase
MQLDRFVNELADIPYSTDRARVRAKSQDMSGYFSPILKGDAEGKVADIVVTPRSKDDILRIARAAAVARMPIICRGAGTCNFGQGIPLAGGAIVDIAQLDRILWINDRKVRAEPGARLHIIDQSNRQRIADASLYTALHARRLYCGRPCRNRKLHLGHPA